MKLRSISLINVRKFAGRRATLDDIGDGITVVSEANEFGKSTFFDALHALFFEKFGSTGRPVKSLQPHSGGSVEVRATIETGAGLFEIEKRWLARKGASVRSLPKGDLVASDGEAEAWITALTGEAGGGPAGLLWVRQGVVGLEPESKKDVALQAETRRDLLSSVAGEIDAMTGGRKMDRVLRLCQSDLKELTTPSGRPGGAWKTAIEAVADLTGQHAVLETQCQSLASALRDRQSVEDELAQMDGPEMRARREADLIAARNTARIAQDHATRVDRAEKMVTIAQLEQDRAQKALDGWIAAHQSWTEARAAQTRIKAAEQAAEVAFAEAGSAASAARVASKAQSEKLSQLRKALEQARRSSETRQAAARVQELQSALKTALAHHKTQVTAEEAVAANPATPQMLERAEAAEQNIRNLEARLAAESTTITMSYRGDLRLMLDGEELSEGAPRILPPLARFDVPGVGEMTLSTGAEDAATSLAEQLGAAQARRAEIFETCNATSIGELRRAARLRVEQATQVEFAGGLLQAVAPKGLDDLRTQVARFQSQAEFPAEEEQADPEEIRTQIAGAEEADQGLRLAQERSEARLAATREAVAVLREQKSAADRAMDVAQAQLGPEDGWENARLDLARSLAVAQEKCEAAQAALDTQMSDAPDQVTAQANLKRAEDAEKALAKRRSDLAERRSALSATIEAQADRDVEARRDEVAGELASACAQEAMFAREVAGLTRLRVALEDARSSARDAYFGPVQEELTPLLRILHDDAALSFDPETMLPETLSRGTAAEDMDTLSGGTQEQIAILTRLAFARLFARQGRSLPIILDDALVYSDDSRIIKMFTALNRVADDQQILVFSCRQLAFANLGGERPSIRVTDV